MSEPTIPPLKWRCFHCDAVFAEHQEKYAREHFGRTEADTPVCQMRVPGENGLLAALRKAQDELSEYRAEDTALMRAIQCQAADYEQRLVREEEKGYARGLKDYTALESRYHAAESERDRLAERLRRAEELGREAMRICKASMPTSTPGCGCGVCLFAAFLAEANPTT